MSLFPPAVGFSTVAINYVFEPTAKKKQVSSPAGTQRCPLGLIHTSNLCLLTGRPDSSANQWADWSAACGAGSLSSNQSAEQTDGGDVRLRSLCECDWFLTLEPVCFCLFINVCFCVRVQRPSAAEYRRFDLLAVQPTSEKLFHVSFTDCLDVTASSAAAAAWCIHWLLDSLLFVFRLPACCTTLTSSVSQWRRNSPSSSRERRSTG